MKFSTRTNKAINLIILMSFFHFVNTTIMIMFNELYIKNANL